MCSGENQAKTQRTGMPGEGLAQGMEGHNVTCLKYECEFQEVIVGVYFLKKWCLRRWIRNRLSTMKTSPAKDQRSRVGLWRNQRGRGNRSQDKRWELSIIQMSLLPGNQKQR